MFEWHGWATIVATPEPDDNEAADDREREVVEQVIALIGEVAGSHNETADLRVANGLVHLWLAGSHNHRADAVVDLYRAVARIAHGSYGVMYVLDWDRGPDWERWVMRRGDVVQEPDASLSPHIPVAEDGAHPHVFGMTAHVRGYRTLCIAPSDGFLYTSDYLGLGLVTLRWGLWARCSSRYQ